MKILAFLLCVSFAIAQQPRTVVKISSSQAVALVDTNDAADLKEWGSKAGTLCVEWFPKITALLPSEGFTAPKEVTLYFDPSMKGVAHAANGKITISAAFVRAHPDDWGMVVHELTHVVQAYPPGGPGWLVEGIADWVRIVHFEPQAARPKLTRLASYKDAYKTTAMFLEWIEKHQSAGFVVKMNAALRAGKYRDELWKEITGKIVDDLWAQFIGTRADPYARYRSDDGLESTGGVVTAWKGAVGKNLARIHGAPRVWKVRTPRGVKEVVRFDGSSAVWAAANDWGRMEGARTILIYARVDAGDEGVLCDGSTRSGADPQMVKGSDGKWQVYRFTSEVGALGGFIVGADVATKNGLKCDVAEVCVHSRLLEQPELLAAEARMRQDWGDAVDLPDSEQIQPIAPFAGLTTKMLRKSGEDGVNTYRIPGLATSKKGTLLAVFDLRHDNSGDLPGNIDVGLTRSIDDGETWSATQRVLDYDGSGVGDPCILVDRGTGSIFVAALWSRGNRAWNGSGPGMTAEETGQLVLTRSDDDGVTWSKPINITSQIKQPVWRLCFNGPGSGIQMKDGTLVMPAQFRDEKGTPHSCFISSRDHGETWKMSPPCEGPTSEAQIAETTDGMLISMRDESRSGQRKWQRFDGSKWSKSWLALPDPTCQASLLRHPNGTLLFSNPANPKARTTLTVRSSQDDGQTWSEGRVIDPRGSMYSCMSVMRDGRIAMVYEGAGGLILARFAVEGANLAVLPEGRFETTGKFGWWPARHAQKVAEPKENVNVLFLGDSITQGWESAGADVWKTHFGSLKAANYGFGGDSTQHVLWRLDHGECDGMKPKVCVLHIGTNNAKHGDFTPAQIAAGIQAVLDKLAVKLPQTKVLLLAIFPRDADAKGELRMKCDAVNALLPALADGKRVHFLNINAAFLQADGTLTREIAPDLLHLSAKGYELWAKQILPHLDNL